MLDTFAVLAFLEGEPAAQRVADVLSSGEPWMTLVNLGEVTYIVERARGRAAADTVFANLLADERPDGGKPIRWLAVDEALVRRAASLKALGGLSYADCFAAAATAILGCPVLTGDPQFAAAERAGIAVEWL
ncbi:MAG: type II toxin-antitoxin system VapC family toxin [Chloroflexi bacterium]|nr:type II toxin-antitoxin system VapC family toxin [Chloroflexota bacterium]